MIIVAKYSRKVCIRRLHSDELHDLADYLQNLGEITKKRFGPHPFDLQSLLGFYQNLNENEGYIAEDIVTKQIVAYSIIKPGYLEHDRLRLQSYDLSLNEKTDCTFAPSVADNWQSCGIGNAMFRFILSELKPKGIQRIILWGGVQGDNKKAIKFYKRNGFKALGQFEYNGLNEDMILNLYDSEGLTSSRT